MIITKTTVQFPEGVDLSLEGVNRISKLSKTINNLVEEYQLPTPLIITTVKEGKRDEVTIGKMG